MTILKSKTKDQKNNVSRRSQEYEQKINSGKIYELAEVVKDLNKNTSAIADQSYSERQLFEKAYDRLQKVNLRQFYRSRLRMRKMDKALGRNQNLENNKKRPFRLFGKGVLRKLLIFFFFFF